MTSTINLSIVIPVYKAELTLRKLYEELTREIKLIKRSYEVIFVEDGGGDGSWKIIKELISIDKHVKGIKLKKNYGQHNALLAGIRLSEGELIVTMDDDLQHPPDQIIKLIRHLESGYDLVYGSPESEQHGFLRDFASVATKGILYKIIKSKTAQQMSAFRVFRSEIKKSFSNYKNSIVNIDVLLSWGTSNQSSIKVKHNARVLGNSNYTFLKLIDHALNVSTGLSTLPLKISGIIGVIFMLFGILVLTYTVLIRIFYGVTVPGFAFIACLVALFSGVQLLVLSVIGQYIGQIFLGSIGMPPYIVDSEDL